MEKTNLNKLKDEISRRKSAKNIVNNNNNNNGSPKDTILSSLVESLNSGHETIATTKIKMVTNKAAVKNKEPIVYKDVNTSNINQRQQIPINENNNVNRDDLFYSEVEKLSKQYNQQSMLPQQQPVGNMLNEDVVKKVISDNFSHLIDEALKSAIVRIYTEEHIREILTENENVIKKVVMSTLREISKKSKNK
jgi:hypothetical protein